MYNNTNKNEIKSYDYSICSRSWYGWTIDTNTYEMIVPDISRVYRRPFEGLSTHTEYMTELFNRERQTIL